MSRSASAQDGVESAAEPHHHIILQNGVIRLMRVLIPPGEATAWQTHRLDYAALVLSGAHIRTEQNGGNGVEEADMPAGSVHFGAYAQKPATRRITNTGSTLYHQIAFELLRPEPGGFGPADRKEAQAFEPILDKPLLRAWRLRLGPGETTPRYAQNGPGVRVILQGERVIDTKPGEWGHEAPVRPGDALFLPPASRTLTNAAETPLDLVEFEIR